MAPYGLLLEYGHIRVGFDGGPGSEPPENIHAWLVSDERSVLHGELPRIARETGMPEPAVAPYSHGPLKIDPLRIAGHRHAYQIKVGHHLAVWAPECPELPAWVEGADLVFADGSPDQRGLTGLQEIARTAKRLRVQRLVFVNLGAAALSAVDSGEPPLYGEWGEEGRKYRL